MSVHKLSASPGTNSTNFCNHHYYGPLIDSYIKSILKSGLLLDEDLEVLLSISKFRNFPERSSYRPSLSLLASIISLLGSSFLAKELKMPLVIVPTVIASAHFIVLEYKRERRKEENVKLMHKLLEALNKIQKLTKNVERHLKTRCDLGKTKDHNPLLLYGKNVEEFMTAFLQNNCNLFKYLIGTLESFAAYSPDLKEDFAIIESLNYTDILRCENSSDIETCLQCTQKIYDVNVLIFSKLLNYIGVVFNLHTLLESDISYLINKTLPNVVKTLRQHQDIVKKQFVSLRHSANKKSEIKLQRDMDKRKNICSKLETTLISSVNNLSVILEKSQIVLDKLENENNSTEIGKDILDLRNHTFATYESLDLLCRLYGIISNSNINKSDDHKITKTPHKDTESSETLPLVKFDDDTEPVEEKFELYIAKDEGIDENQPREYEDQSGAYLSLMLQELKQSLKQHERFIEAKSKRGDEDEEEIDITKNRISRKEQIGPPPKFDLRELRDEPVKSLPPPPPPPLPSFSVSDLEQESGQINARSMLENIKVLSSQRNVEEEVFGDSGESSNDSD